MSTHPLSLLKGTLPPWKWIFGALAVLAWGGAAFFWNAWRIETGKTNELEAQAALLARDVLLVRGAFEEEAMRAGLPLWGHATEPPLFLADEALRAWMDRSATSFYLRWERSPQDRAAGILVLHCPDPSLLRWIDREADDGWLGHGRVVLHPEGLAFSVGGFP